MDLSGNPMVLFPGDAPGSGYTEIRAANQPIFLASIEWVGCSSGAICDLKDGLDRELFFRQAGSGEESISLAVSAPIAGLHLYTLTAGQLYLHLR